MTEITNTKPIQETEARQEAPRAERMERKSNHRERVAVDKDLEELEEKIIFVNRVATVVKGGRRFSFAVLVAVGDKKGNVGLGMGKAKEVPEAVRKGLEVARKNMVKIALRGPTIPHEINFKFGGAKIFLRPAPAGTGVIAGGAMRPIIELAGIKDIWTKSIGSSNQINIAKATVKALGSLRTIKEIAAMRGKSVSDLKYW